MNQRKRKMSRLILCVVFSIAAAGMAALYLSDGNMQAYRTDKKSSSGNPVNWKKLKKVNPDIYAWIQIPGTDIDYGIAQAGEEKENFYLYHNARKQYSFAGMIFSQKNNARDFSDPLTVLYGHNMRNGSMFGELKNFKDSKFLNKHDMVYIYTPDQILTYRICSAVQTDDSSIFSKYDFSSGLDPEYIRLVRGKRKISKKDQLLTLSTCSTPGRRLIVTAKRKQASAR